LENSFGSTARLLGSPCGQSANRSRSAALVVDALQIGQELAGEFQLRRRDRAVHGE
jgi:hypothetical protein